MLGTKELGLQTLGTLQKRKVVIIIVDANKMNRHLLGLLTNRYCSNKLLKDREFATLFVNKATDKQKALLEMNFLPPQTNRKVKDLTICP